LNQPLLALTIHLSQAGEKWWPPSANSFLCGQDRHPRVQQTLRLQCRYDVSQQECGGGKVISSAAWRMIFGSARHIKNRMAAQLVADLRSGNVPVVHRGSIPKLSIIPRHRLFDCKETTISSILRLRPKRRENPVPVTFNRSRVVSRCHGRIL